MSRSVTSRRTPRLPRGSYEQLGEVVPGHVLHRAPAGAEDLALTQGHPQAQDEIAGHAIAHAKRPGQIRRRDTSEGGPFHAGRVEGKHLTVGGREALQLAQGHSRLHRNREIVRVVVHHLM